MSKISFAIEGKKVFTFNESLEKRYHTFPLFLLSWLVKILFFLFVLTCLLSFFGLDYVIFNNLMVPFAVLFGVFGLTRLVILGVKYELKKPTLSEIFLLVTVVVLGISRLLTKNAPELLLPNVGGIMEVVSYFSLLTLSLSLLFFLRNYSNKVLKVIVWLGYALVTVKVFLDMFNVIKVLVEAFQAESKQISNVNGLTFEVYMVAIALYYVLLKVKMKIYYKILSYSLLISSLFLLAYSMKSVATYWVVALTALVLLIVELILNYKKVLNFFKLTIKTFKEKRYVSFVINLIILVAVLGLSLGGLYLLFSKLNFKYVTGEFTTFYQNLTSANVPLRIFSSDQLLGAKSTLTLMEHVGLNFGLLPLLSILSLVGLSVYKVIKHLPLHSEVLLYFLIFGLVHSILMPISLLPILVLAFVYLFLAENKTRKEEHKENKEEHKENREEKSGKNKNKGESKKQRK